MKLTKEERSELIQFIKYGQEAFIPFVSLDCVIFGYDAGELKVLLYRPFNGKKWVLPGGFIGKKESTDAAAARTLKEITGLSELYLEQFKVFGNAQRSFAAYFKSLSQFLGIPEISDSWLVNRFITIGYYALVNFNQIEFNKPNFASELKWFEVGHLPATAMDHGTIILEGHKRLRLDLISEKVGYNLLSEKFTMPELQQLHETILDQTFERSHFQKKMIKSGDFVRLKEMRNGVPHKRPYLYRFIGHR